MALRLILVLLMLPGALAAGPWPRAPGTVFLSTGTEVWDADDGQLGQFSDGYLEYGATPRLSLGAKLSQGSFSGMTAEIFLGWNVLQTGPHVASLEFGMVHNANTTFTGEMRESSGYEVALNYGRGFSIGQRPGWATVEARMHQSDQLSELKLDATFGVSFDNGVKAMSQVFVSRIGDDTQIKLAPGVVVPLSDRFQIEFGLRIPGDDPDRSALRVGL